MFRVGWLILAFAFLNGCATATPQVDTYLKSPSPGLPREARVEGVPFIDQAENHCGPATLAMATAWVGQPITVQELTKQVYTPGANGTFQADMVSAARRNGFLAITTAGLPSLVIELAAGHPVIIFENLAFSWYPKWHYAIATGYDLNQEEVFLHSGPVKDKRWDLRKFERSWKLGDYWALVVLKPGQLAASADDLAHATAAAALENVGHADKAETVYESLLVKWPTSLPSLIGLANFAYARKNYGGAVEYLTRATQAHPEAAAAWHNLAIAQGRARNIKAARASASRALTLAPVTSRETYRTNLREYLDPVL